MHQQGEFTARAVRIGGQPGGHGVGRQVSHLLELFRQLAPERDCARAQRGRHLARQRLDARIELAHGFHDVAR